MTAARRLRRDARVPRRTKLAVAFAGLCCCRRSTAELKQQPTETISDSRAATMVCLPGSRAADQARSQVIALALHYAGRWAPHEVLFEAWPAEPGRRAIHRGARCGRRARWQRWGRGRLSRRQPGRRQRPRSRRRSSRARCRPCLCRRWRRSRVTARRTRACRPWAAANAPRARPAPHRAMPGTWRTPQRRSRR